MSSLSPKQIRWAMVLLGLTLPMLTVGISNNLAPFLSLPSLVFFVGASGLIQSILSEQGVPLIQIRSLGTADRWLGFHHILGSSHLLAACLPGLVLGYALYQRCQVTLFG